MKFKILELRQKEKNCNHKLHFAIYEAQAKKLLNKRDGIEDLDILRYGFKNEKSKKVKFLQLQLQWRNFQHFKRQTQ